MAIEVPSPVTTRTQQTSQALVGPSGAGGTPEAFGAGVGAALGDFGGRVSQLGDFIKQQDLQVKRFDALRRFSDFEEQANTRLTESAREAPTNLANFSEKALTDYKTAEAQFIKQLPPEVQQEFSVRTGDLGNRIHAAAFKQQLDMTDTFYRNGIEDGFNKERNELGQGGTAEDLDAARARLDEIINSSGLSEAEKVAIKRKGYTGLEQVVYKNEQIKRLFAEAQGGENGPAQSSAVELMGIIDGAASPDELTSRARQGENDAVADIGSVDTWAALPARVRATLIAVAADYGGLPDSVVSAAKSGNLEAIAEAVKGLPTPGADTLSDNVLNPGTTIDDDPRYANLPYEDRLALRQDAEREVNAAITQQHQVEKAQNAAKVNALHVALFDGTAGQTEIDNAREQGWLSDINDIEKAQKLLDNFDKETKLAAQALAKINAGMSFDPMSDDDKKSLNALVGKQGIALLQQNNPRVVTDVLVPMVTAAQDIPTDVAGLLIGMARGPDPQRANYALDALAQLQEASPRGFDQRLSEADASMVEFWRTHKELYPTDELMRHVRGGLTEEERRRTKELRNEAKELLNDKTLKLDQVPLQAFSWGGFLGLGSGSPTIMGADALPWAAKSLQSDFNTYFTDEYARTGDVNRAKDLAVKDLKRYWGTVNIGGRTELMKYPPEAAGYRPIGGDFKWIEDQTMSDLGLSWGGGEGTTKIQNFQLISDSQTRDEVESQKVGWWGGAVAPSYMVAYTDANGVPKIAMDENGLPRRVFFQRGQKELDAETAAFNERRNQALQVENWKQGQAAVEHSLETGQPIPPDAGFIDNGAANPNSILNMMMGGVDAVP